MATPLRITLKPIVPKKRITDPGVLGRVSATMRQGAGDFAGAMRKYPPARPWKNPPKSGPRKGGKRLGGQGGLASGWKLSFTLVSFTVFNDISYAVWVQGRNEGEGKKQTAIMRGRGWQSISDVADTQEKSLNAALRRAFRQRR